MCVCIIPAPSELCTLSLHAALPIFACAHDAEAGPDLVAELGLDLVEVDRELAIALQLAAGEVGDHFLVGRAEAGLAVVADLHAQEERAVLLPAAGILPQLRRLRGGHKRLERTGGVH